MPESLLMVDNQLEKLNHYDSEFESIRKLLQAISNDPVINDKVSRLLKMAAYPRRLVLNNWLEQLRIQNAPLNLLDALTCLFDDNIVAQVLSFIKKHT